MNKIISKFRGKRRFLWGARLLSSNKKFASLMHSSNNRSAPRGCARARKVQYVNFKQTAANNMFSKSCETIH